MKRSNDVQEKTNTQVTSLFERILVTLPTGCAVLTVERQKAPDGFFSVAIVPANEQSAEFAATVLGGDVYSTDFGRGQVFTTFEAPWELNLPRSATLDQQLDVVSKMCLAVIGGRCEHRFERRSTVGVIQVSEKEVYSVGDTSPLRLLLPRKNAEIRRYSPYCPGVENHILPFPRPSL